MTKTQTDVVIVGGGAAGLMCAIEAGKRGRSVLVVEHNRAIGDKIRISGGGRCNFTNRDVDSTKYLSGNPDFCKSALARYGSPDFVALVERHGIGYHEKTLGQLFCNDSSQQILDLLFRECSEARVRIQIDTSVKSITKGDHFSVITSKGEIEAEAVVIASGGLSIPKLGASNFGYRIARQFGLNVVAPRPGLVPLKFDTDEARNFGELSGVSVDAIVRSHEIEFRENVLFTHKGLSGPAILQISSYWRDGEEIIVNLLPEENTTDFVDRIQHSKMLLSTALETRLPRRLAVNWCQWKGAVRQVNQYSEKELRAIVNELTQWRIRPAGTEGFGKAEVTVGGVDTVELSSKTMGSKKCPGLYFIGEVVDVTGWLGGYNFQWAWSSGWVAGQFA